MTRGIGKSAVGLEPSFVSFKYLATLHPDKAIAAWNGRLIAYTPRKQTVQAPGADAPPTRRAQALGLFRKMMQERYSSSIYAGATAPLDQVEPLSFNVGMLRKTMIRAARQEF